MACLLLDTDQGYWAKSSQLTPIALILEVRMRYICVKCDHTWIVDEYTDYVSGGVCRDCITEYIRSKQVKNGNNACFGRPDLCKDEKDCPYRQCCMT